MSRWIAMAALAACWLASCGSPPALEVRPLHLRSVEVADANEGERMVRAEQLRRFHGAIGIREKERRLGHYYAVSWRDERVGEPVRVVFEYQQGSTGSEVFTETHRFEGSRREGRAEFRIIGEDYLEGGRVLAWRCSLWRGDHEMASKRSYLWE